jgi:sugar lactone lactonase YvrE
MPKVSSIAFGANHKFASCHESRDEWNGADQPPDDFMGPTLWQADLDIFANVHQGDDDQEGSHLDMLHESPWCMGIAWDEDNVYWAFDGLHGDLVRYDFRDDHGPGGTDHSDGIVRRYVEAKVKRAPGIASHMVLDHQSGMLYLSDTGNGRVMRLDTRAGKVTGKLTGNLDGLDEYSKVQGASYTVFADQLGKPSGIELHHGRLFVSDYADGRIVAYSLDGKQLGSLETGARGLMGITIGPDGKLWFVDNRAQTVVRVDP